MIFLQTPTRLQDDINHMAMPVFVADLDKAGEFRFKALNTAHTEATGLSLDHVYDKTPSMVLSSPEEAAHVAKQYQTCLNTNRPISYSETLTFRGRAMVFNTTLHPLAPDGGQPTRIVGEAQVEDIGATAGETTEAAFYASQAKNPLTAMEQALAFIRNQREIKASDLETLEILVRRCGSSLDDVIATLKSTQRLHPVKASPPSGPALIEHPDDNREGSA